MPPTSQTYSHVNNRFVSLVRTILSRSIRSKSNKRAHADTSSAWKVPSWAPKDLNIFWLFLECDCTAIINLWDQKVRLCQIGRLMAKIPQAFFAITGGMLHLHEQR